MGLQAASQPSRDRIASVDIIRGAVMVLMAIDHVRVFAGVPTNGPPGVFFTRWVTHFCAPAFIFLAGTAAYLYGRKVESRSSLARFLVIRGMWLVLLELTVLRFGWTFNFDYANFTFAGVIWVIGWSMVVLAALVFLPVRVVGAIGLAIILLHNGLAPVLSGGENPSPIMQVLYAGGNFGVAGLNIVVLYVLLPWAGVMAAGFAFGAVLREPAERRKRICITLGLVAIVLFVALRATGVYGDPREWSSDNGPLAFLNPAKYPPSLQFLLMTLGPTILAIPFLENARGRIAGWLRVFGQVPFFFYVLHIPLIHLSALLISLVRTPASTGWLIANHPMLPPEVPEGYRWSLGLLYLVWAIVIVLLYLACKWYAGVKARSNNQALRFL
jgi:uncharacterized membrane protein